MGAPVGGRGNIRAILEAEIKGADLSADPYRTPVLSMFFGLFYLRQSPPRWLLVHPVITSILAWMAGEVKRRMGMGLWPTTS
jgi:hypothetical protein